VTEDLTFTVPAGATVTWYPTGLSATGPLYRLRIGLPTGWVLSLVHHPFAMGRRWEAAATWDDDDLIDVWGGLDAAGVQARIDEVAAWA
jgi:hypothetical protein